MVTVSSNLLRSPLNFLSLVHPMVMVLMLLLKTLDRLVESELESKLDTAQARASAVVTVEIGPTERLFNFFIVTSKSN